tara:strand:+ start:139 stop:1407 length:1269 start_codon:yes stop_codon:yes gene_type:complete
MINRVGLSGVVNNLTSNNSGKGSRGAKTLWIVGRVNDIILDENHPSFLDYGGWNGVGTAFISIVDASNSDKPIIAKSLYSNFKSFPIINELVFCFLSPTPTLGTQTYDNQYYYINTINLWNAPNHNASPNPTGTITLEQSQEYQSYEKAEAGSVRRIKDSSTEIPLNSPSNPSQNTFREETNIHPLMPFMGDLLYEGRFGNSIRLGSTAKSKSEYKNSWSVNGKNGDPITIIRNGQPGNSSNEGWLPITEDLKNDLSSLYLTSYQRLSKFTVASENYSSYITPPAAPSQWVESQIALSSNRIVLNAKTDSILLSSQKSIGLSTNGSVNIDSKSYYTNCNDIKLGSKEATEPVLKGDITVDILIQLTNSIQNLADILKVEKNWSGGVLQTGYNAVAGNVLLTLKGVISQLNDGSLKSKTTKVQ